MHKRHIRFFFLVITCVLWSCANQTQPTGGPKDEEPPVLKSSNPEQSTINVTTNKVEISFDEAIKTNNPKEQLIISPRVDIEFDIKYRKNKAIITFEDNLPDSTTFTFNFREAIVDITEANAPENLKLAFSTGSYLDSLSISGNISSHLSNTFSENATVALYETTDTLDIFTGPALYFTKTNEAGDYIFDNIKAGEYKIYAFQDNNKNLTAQSNSESYGFKSGNIFLDSSINPIDIPLLNLDVRPLELQSARQSGTTFNIKYNKSLTDYQLIPNTNDRLVSAFSDSEQNNIRIYNTFDIKDSLQVFISARDSLNQSSQDTIYLKFEPTKRQPVDLNQASSIQKIVVEERLVRGSINFNKPITQMNLDSAYIYIDSTHIYPLDSSHLRWNRNNTYLDYSYLLDKKLFTQKEEETPEPSTDVPTQSTPTPQDSSNIIEPKPEQKPHVRFAEASFITAEQDSSSNIKTDLTFTTIDQLGLISITIETQQPSFIVQLLDAQNNIVQEKINTKEFDFQYVNPGAYRIRILIDANNNGKWDPGNINLDIEPEPVLFYEQSTGEQEVIIRANFEIEPDPIRF